ncbi:CocE/NonD family hydrolase C-terminal non-catalytic domain-containing protein [Sphingomonas sp. MMS24-JH45]
MSDPAKPVPHLPRPVNFDDGRWGDWLVSDQRHADGRPDVLTYQTAPLTRAVRVSGAPFANIFARTTGTDGDFVVKIIDVFPPENATDPKIGGYQLPDQPRHLSRPLSRQLLAAKRDPGGEGAALPLPPPAPR